MPMAANEGVSCPPNKYDLRELATLEAKFVNKRPMKY